MAYGPRYRVVFRRRREGKTNYRRRRGLVLSGLPRFVVRCTLKRVIAQMVKAEIVGDKVVVAADSRELAKRYGWLGSCSNLSAAYLTGLLCGYKALGSGVKEAVFDIGLQSPTKGAKIFAALKGVLDAGVVVPHDEKVLPSENRIQGQHVVAYAKGLASTPEIYKARFSEVLSRGLSPEELVEHFVSVREKVVSSFKEMKLEKEEVKVKPEAEVKPKVEKKRKTKGKVVSKAKAKSKRRVSEKKESEVGK